MSGRMAKNMNGIRKNKKNPVTKMPTIPKTEKMSETEIVKKTKVTLIVKSNGSANGQPERAAKPVADENKNEENFTGEKYHNKTLLDEKMAKDKDLDKAEKKARMNGEEEGGKEGQPIWQHCQEES